MKILLKGDDAVSPMVAMMLLLVIVTSTIGAIYAVGLPRIESAEDRALMQNMRNSFTVLQGDIREVVQSPSAMGQEKVTKISIDRGTLYIYPTSVENGTGYIQYSTGEQVVAYENGAVFQKNTYEDYSEMVSDPMMYVVFDDNNITHINFHQITINGSNEGSVSGSSTQRIRLERGDVSTPVETQLDEVTFMVESVFHRGWEDYFDKLLTDAGLEDGYGYTINAIDDDVTLRIIGNSTDAGVNDIYLYYVNTDVNAEV
ncbi:MAG: hypothetical protein SVY15_02060 [Halobacteriota archaeon]|nr:hypothetical protein [Halobacteriota archaeon]